MEIESYLTDVYGPRLTGSPNMTEAGEWAQKTMKDWGLANVHLESWPFGRGWQNQMFFAMAMTPRAYPLIGYPKAWTPGTNGRVTGEAVIAVINERRTSRRSVESCAASSCSARRRATCPLISSRKGAATRIRSSPTSRNSPSRAGAADAGGRGNFEAAQDFNRKKRSSGSMKASRLCSASARGTAARSSSRAAARAIRRVCRHRRTSSSPSSSTAGFARTLEKKIPVTLSMEIDKHVLRHRSQLLQHRRRPSRYGQGRRGRHDRRALRLVAHRHRRHGQRGRLRDHDGGDAHLEDHRCEAAPHRADRSLGR